MQKIKVLFIRLRQQFYMIRSKKTDIVITKTIYDWENKKPSRIYSILHLEVQYLLEKHSGYKLRGFKKPVHLTNGALLYKIILKKKQ